MTQRVNLQFGPEMSKFILAGATGRGPNGTPVREIIAFGTRGDGKTWGALGTMIHHASLHHQAGYPLPVKWAGVTDTFRSHTEKTHDSLTSAGWGGVWRLVDGGHEAQAVVDGTCLVRLRLFGIEDQGAMNRLRMETTGLWFEEPAPALTVSSGVSEDAWGLGLTSQRLASHFKPALITSNYPDEDHWTWQRFIAQPRAGCLAFRIPPGERASDADREAWASALGGRQDLLRRLLQGEPGTIQLGEQVASGFRYDSHVAVGRRLEPQRGQTLWIGQDGGESHTWVSVIGQRVDGRVRVYAALLSDPSGARQHVKSTLLPWLGEHAPWVLDSSKDQTPLAVCYDQSMDSEDPGDAESNPLRTFRALVPGRYRPGPVSWAGRLNPMLAVFNAMALGQPVLEIAPQARGLITALNGGWYYPKDTATGKVTRDIPKKPNHPHEDYGDAFCYLIAALAPMSLERHGRAGVTKPYLAKTTFNALGRGLASRILPRRPERF
jgi:hypothetical protein